MTNAVIFSTFEAFIHETLDRSIEVSLAEQARIELETELKLQISKKLDTANTSTVGGTYLTPYAMQSDVLVPAGERIYVGLDPYIAIPFEDRVLYKDTNGFWYFDQANNNFYLCGSQTLAQTITFPYITAGTSIADNTNTVLKWPADFHILVPMRMAQLWYAIDAGDKARSYAPEWLAFYKQTKNNLIDWDAQWKLTAVNNSTPPNSPIWPRPTAINALPPFA
jgi:hypothetical protein